MILIQLTSCPTAELLRTSRRTCNCGCSRYLSRLPSCDKCRYTRCSGEDFFQRAFSVYPFILLQIKGLQLLSNNSKSHCNHSMVSQKVTTSRLLRRVAPLPPQFKRSLASAIDPHRSTRKNGSKAEGTIASVFASMSGDAELGMNLPSRFADLKRSLIANPNHAAACKYASSLLNNHVYRLRGIK